jgi:hypothetical protein
MTEIERRAPAATTQDRRIRELELKFATHEAVCAERYKGIREDLTSFQKIIAKVGYGLMAGMAAILVKLVFFP